MITDNQNGTFTVKTASGNTFNIVESDSHTQSMLTDFLNTPECLTEFEELLDADPRTAYNRYNKLPDTNPNQDNEAKVNP